MTEKRPDAGTWSRIEETSTASVEDSTRLNPIPQPPKKAKDNSSGTLDQATAPMPKIVSSPGSVPTRPTFRDPLPPVAVSGAPALSGSSAGSAVPAPSRPQDVAPVVIKDPPSRRRTRKARLRLTRIDPWSVMKTAFLFSIAFGIMMWVSVYVVWSVVEASGLFDSLNNVMNTALGNPDGTSNFRLQDYLNAGRVLGYTALLSVLNIVIITALTTLFSFLYNLSATVLGGLEVTLAED